jgi:nucleotide-binding universal stress UspA family protein
VKPGVVVGYDHTPSSEAALDAAAVAAVRRRVELTVVHAVHHPVRHPHHRLAHHAAKDAPDSAEQAAERMQTRHPDLTVQIRVPAGSAVTVLADLSSDADLLVVAHHRHGSLAAPVGSAAPPWSGRRRSWSGCWKQRKPSIRTFPSSTNSSKGRPR